jgi:hypothetical protein
VLTDLIDGRWEQALQVLTTSTNNGQEISNLLKSDRGRLWNRSTVALRLNPARRAALAWAYLILTVQRGEERANSWLQGQPNISDDTILYLQDLLAKLNGKVTSDHQSQIIGRLQKITGAMQFSGMTPTGERSLNSKSPPLDYQRRGYNHY